MEGAQGHMRMAADASVSALQYQLQVDSVRERRSWAAALTSFLEAVKGALSQVQI